MKKILGLTVLALGLILPSPVLAQTGGGQGMGPGGGMGPGMGPGRGMGPRMYNPQTVTTIQGTVESQGPQFGRMPHESWVVKTAQGNITVHLGPSWYFSQHQMVIKVGDNLEATGSQVQVAKGPMLIAKEVTVNGKSLKLRDEQGLPLWRGAGRPQPQ